MDTDKLISKKDVLRTTGISYGQLYRWKRKGLIPEDWFIRRATFTGQETFFPRDKILTRIEQIKRMKEVHPLDDLAALITHKIDKKLEVAFSRLRNLDWLDERLAKLCEISPENGEVVPLADAFCIGVLRQLRTAARDEEVTLVKRTLDTALEHGLIERVRAEELRLYLVRKHIAAGGLSAEISTVVIAPPQVLFDPDLTVVKTVDLRAIIDAINLDIAAAGDHQLKDELKEKADRIKEQELERFKQKMARLNNEDTRKEEE